MQAQALRPFQRLDPARGVDAGGTGLGLGISRGIIEQCGGELGFVRDEAGFAVRVRLPLGAAE